ncbi:MAG: HAMP domain-containing protein [Magnetovibrio sp.]|nr:HAMP domain-containing protein [Magnetovibrio sp.]
MSKPFRIGIRGRLFWAFGAVATATIVATVIAWVSFTRLGDTMQLIIGSNVPAVTLAAQLAEHGGGIIGTAPALSSAKDDADREQVWLQLSARLEDMNAALDTMAKSSTQTDNLAQFKNAVSALSTNLQKLDAIVSQRLSRTVQKEELSERLRWASADFLDEIEPMIDDIRFNLSLALTPDARPSQTSDTLTWEMAKQQSLLSINADGSLLAELIARAATIPNTDALRGTQLYFQEIESRIETNLKTLETVPGALSLHQSIKDIQAFADGPLGMFDLRARELSDVEMERTLLIKNQQLLAPLHDLITGRVDEEIAAALQSAERSQASIRQGRFWLVVAVFVSLVVAAPFLWFYVGHGLVGRITRLDQSMRAIADGDLRAEVPVGGEDEIADMAVSLRSFRDTLSETQAELVQAAKLAALGQLTAGISHEINQPLAAIRHYARNAGVLIDKDRTLDAKKNLIKISELVEKTNRIIGGLRQLARKPQRDLRRTDVMVVFDDVLTLLDRRVRDGAIEVTVQIDASCRYVLAGQVRLEQVVLNLINNAIDAMDGGAVRRLIISTRLVDEWVELRLRDTGMGMDEEVLGKVFDPFFTTKDVGEGLGLGLSVSYNIVKDFGGTIRAESKIGEGTTFWLRLKPAS